MHSLLTTCASSALFLGLSLAPTAHSATTAPLTKTAITCEGIRLKISDGGTEQTKVALDTVVNTNGVVVLEGKIDNRSFSVSSGAFPGSYLVSITLAPEHTHGVIATTQMTQEGRLQISTVEGSLVHKLECREQVL